MTDALPLTSETSGPWIGLCTQHLLTALWRQRGFGEILGEASWSVDVPAGTITFEGHEPFGMQILGTESDNGTWLWSWANAGSGLPDQVLKMARAVQSYGESAGVSALTTPLLAVEDSEAWHLALVCAAATSPSPVYRAPYPGGAMYCVVEVDMSQAPSPDGPAFLTLLQEMLTSPLRVHHRDAVRTFCDRFTLPRESSGNDDVMRTRHGDVVASYDDLGRLTRLSASLAEPGAPAGEPAEPPAQVQAPSIHERLLDAYYRLTQRYKSAGQQDYTELHGLYSRANAAFRADDHQETAEALEEFNALWRREAAD